MTLPTGLGKTFIAAVVMYNFYRWYPQGRIVFMAPTKPLVAQQVLIIFLFFAFYSQLIDGVWAPDRRDTSIQCRSENWTCLVFKVFECHLKNQPMSTIWKPDHKPDSKTSCFKWFRFLNGQFSDPNFMKQMTYQCATMLLKQVLYHFIPPHRSVVRYLCNGR